MLQYCHTWGDEDILESQIEVTKGFINNTGIFNCDIYTITFQQESFDHKLFSDIHISNIATVISKNIDEAEYDNGITIRLITIKVEAINNPKPEDIFRIIPIK